MPSPENSVGAFRFLIPDEVAGYVIGKEGSTMKRLARTSGVDLTIFRREETPTSLTDRIVTVTGDIDCMIKATISILELMSKELRLGSESRHALVTLVPLLAAGNILGYGGRGLSELKVHDVSVNLSERPIPGLLVRALTLRGSYEGIANSLRIALGKIDEKLLHGYSRHDLLRFREGGPDDRDNKTGNQCRGDHVVSDDERTSDNDENSMRKRRRDDRRSHDDNSLLDRFASPSTGSFTQPARDYFSPERISGGRLDKNGGERIRASLDLPYREKIPENFTSGVEYYLVVTPSMYEDARREVNLHPPGSLSMVRMNEFPNSAISLLDTRSIDASISDIEDYDVLLVKGDYKTKNQIINQVIRKFPTKEGSEESHRGATSASDISWENRRAWFIIIVKNSHMRYVVGSQDARNLIYIRDCSSCNIQLEKKGRKQEAYKTILLCGSRKQIQNALMMIHFCLEYSVYSDFKERGQIEESDDKFRRNENTDETSREYMERGLQHRSRSMCRDNRSPMNSRVDNENRFCRTVPSRMDTQLRRVDTRKTTPDALLNEGGDSPRSRLPVNRANERPQRFSKGTPSFSSDEECYDSVLTFLFPKVIINNWKRTGALEQVEKESGCEQISISPNVYSPTETGLIVSGSAASVSRACYLLQKKALKGK